MTTPVAAVVPCRILNDPLVMTPPLLIVQLTVPKSTGAPVMVHVPVPAPSFDAKPDPATVKGVLGAEGGPGIGGDPAEGEIDMEGPAFTVRNAVSAETNSAMKRISKVTAYRARRNASKSKPTSLKLFE
jgi:hypothetical protein